MVIVASVEDVFSNPIVALLLGSIISPIIIEIIKHFFFNKRSREESLRPYLTRMLVCTSSILHQKSALHLEENYAKWQTAILDQKIPDIALKQIAEEGNSNFIKSSDNLYNRLDSYALMYYLSSCRSIISIIKQCHKFEEEYKAMNKKGLLKVLEVKYKGILHKGLFWKINDLYVQEILPIIELTHNFKGQLDIINEEKPEEDYFCCQDTNRFMLQLVSSRVEDIFYRCSELEKDLKKFL